MIVCGLMMDIMLIVLFYNFAFKGTTWRFPLALLMNNLLRMFLLNMFLMKYPEGYLWEFPGMYSITVPYGKTNDFFYSGHVSTAVISMMEYKATKQYYMASFSFVTMIMQVVLMVFLRGHYMIDLLSGLIFGHYFFIMAERVSYLVDVKLLGIPFFKRFPNFNTHCGGCKKSLPHYVPDHAEETALLH